MNFVHDVNPTWEAEQIAAPFCQALIRSESKLRKKYSVKKQHRWKSGYTALRQVAKEPLPEGFNSRFAYVKTGKMTEEIRDYLVDQKLAVLFDNFEFDKQWLGMRPDLANAYMTALARRVGANGAMQPLTDETQNQAAIAELTIDDIVALYLLDKGDAGNMPEIEQLSSDELRTTYLQMAFRIVLPKDLSHVSVEKIVQLRKSEYTPAFRAFQERSSEWSPMSESRRWTRSEIRTHDELTLRTSVTGDSRTAGDPGTRDECNRRRYACKEALWSDLGRFINHRRHSEPLLMLAIHREFVFEAFVYKLNRTDAHW